MAQKNANTNSASGARGRNTGEGATSGTSSTGSSTGGNGNGTGTGTGTGFRGVDAAASDFNATALIPTGGTFEGSGLGSPGRGGVGGAGGGVEGAPIFPPLPPPPIPSNTTLKPGNYMFVIRTTDVTGADTYHYFNITVKQRRDRVRGTQTDYKNPNLSKDAMQDNFNNTIESARIDRKLFKGI